MNDRGELPDAQNHFFVPFVDVFEFSIVASEYPINEFFSKILYLFGFFEFEYIESHIIVLAE